MGKVSKRLTIVVFPPLDTWPEIEKLKKQGHTVVRVDPSIKNEGGMQSQETLFSSCLAEADIILGPRCWYMTGLHRQHLTQAIKQARLRKYGTISKKGDKHNEKDDIPESGTEPAAH